MVDLYGSANGFGWKLNDVVGAQIVSVPMRVALDRAWHTFEVVMAGLAARVPGDLVLLNLLLQSVIIRPVRRIAATASEVSLGNMDGAGVCRCAGATRSPRWRNRSTACGAAWRMR